MERLPSQGSASSSSFVDRCCVAVAEFPPPLGLASLPSLCCAANSNNLEGLPFYKRRQETRTRVGLMFFLGLGRTRCLFGARSCEVPKRGASDNLGRKI